MERFPFQPLTADEVAVLTLMVSGYTNQQVADELAIGCQTVQMRIYNILEKLRVMSFWIWQRESEQSDGLPLQHLTARELEVLRWVAMGGTNKEIAEIVITSEKTIESHMRSIFNKLVVSDRTLAVVIALYYGLITINIDEIPDDWRVPL